MKLIRPVVLGLLQVVTISRCLAIEDVPHSHKLKLPGVVGVDNTFQLHQGRDLLFPSLGIHAKYVNTMMLNMDEMLLTIVTPLPNVTKIYDILKSGGRTFNQQVCVDQLVTQELIFKSVCGQIAAMMEGNKMATLNIIEDNIKRVDNLVRYLPELRTLQLNDKARGRRFIAATVVAVWAKERFESLDADIAEIRERHDNLQNFTMKLENQVKVLARITDEEFAKVDVDLQYLRGNLSEIAKDLYRNINTMIKQINVLSQQSARIGKLLMFQTKALQRGLALNKIILQTRMDLDHLFDVLTTSFHQLDLGYLPSDLITYTELERILQKASEELYRTHPQYEFVSTLAIPYYEQQEAIYKVEGYTLYIQIPVLIKEKNQFNMDVYNLVSFHVPTDVTKANNRKTDKNDISYTKIDFMYDLVGISRRSYVLLHENQLYNCRFFNRLRVCPSVLLQTHKAVASCITAIFWDQKIEVISKYCPVKYYHNILVPPQVFGTREVLLLANIHTDWEILCSNDQIPRKQIGKRYAMLKKENLCHCKVIIGNAHYLAQKIAGCNVTQNNLRLAYPVNSLMLYNVNKASQQWNRSHDYFSLFYNELNITVPELKVVETINRSKILYDRSRDGVEFHKIITALNKNEEVYLETEDKISRERQLAFSTWFSGKRIGLGITFIMSLIGIVCLIIFVCYCYRQNKQNILGKAMNSVMTGFLPIQPLNPQTPGP